MSSIRKDRHLNVFNYYNYSDKHDSKENNLTRALAITLSNDKRLLNDVFKLFTLDKSYGELFSLDYDLIGNDDIYIDIQKPSDSEELIKGITNNSYKNYIGVLLGSFDEKIVETAEEIENIEPNNTDNPIPDIAIAIKDTLIIVEAKLGGSKKSVAQLKGQVESILNNTESIENPADVEVDYKIIDWSNILKLAMKYTSKEKSKDNLLIYDFVDFVRKYRTDFMPVIPFKEIEIADSISDHAKKMIDQRIEILKTIITQKEEYFNKDELLYETGRSAIPIEFGWASEANISFDENNKSLKLDFWVADTKSQGRKIHKKDEELNWINNNSITVNNSEYNLQIEPYIKFASSWGSDISHVWGTLNEDKKYEKTHNYKVFKKMAGQWKRNENDRWLKNNLDLENQFDQLIGDGWRTDCNWEEYFIDSNRNVLNISFGINVEVEIAYQKARKLDNEKDDSQLAKEIYDILIKLKEMVNQ
jgi:hypothetical protein